MFDHTHRPYARACAASLCLLAIAPTTHAQYATSVIDYQPGADPDPGLDNPANALGEPTRFTGELLGFPGAVTPFNPAFDADELVSIGFGGSLTVAFDQPVRNDALNPFGIDLLVFGNTGFIDGDFPNGVVAGLFGNDGGTIEVSADGDTWLTIDTTPADAPFPTLGYLDLTGPFDPNPGNLETDFTRPVDPAFDFTGAAWADILNAYDGSGGGVGIDIGAVGLDAISYVRISDLVDDGLAPDIDAFADVAPIPAPATALLLLALAHRRRR